MALPVSFPFTSTPSFYTGTATSILVPEVFPVAINGRPYMVDVKSQQFTRQFDQRVRDSQDTSTAPGEAAINPQGLWRRGQNSWHFGAGQQYADIAASQDFRFYKSKGINPWVKGQMSLLNATKLSLSSANTNLYTCVVESGGTTYLYVADGNVLKFSSNPFAATPTWTSVTTNTAGGNVPNTAITSIETNGTNVYIAWTSNDIWYTTPGSTSATFFYAPNPDNGKTYYAFGYAKNRGFAAQGPDIHQPALSSPTHAIFYDNPDSTFTWVGFAAGQNAVYAAGYSGTHSSVFKITIKADGTLDVPVVALELPVGEVVSAIHGYLGFVLIGSNRGVRFCSTDGQNNLIAGSLIPTSGKVNDFTTEDRFVWFGWSNYDGSSGLGRLDLSVFTSPNTPAYATDLMYASTNEVKSVSSFQSKRVFTISGVGVIVEDTANLVTSGEFETGIYQWGIPDDKFAPRVDVRTEPLNGTISAAVAVENQGYSSIGVFNIDNETRYTYIAPENKFIQAGYKFTLTRESATVGPLFTRWMSRAYAAPARSRIISVPILLHERFNINNKDYYFDVALERDLIEELAASPRIVTYQEKDDTFSVIIEDARWQPSLSSGTDWLWEGTMVVIMRTITE